MRKVGLLAFGLSAAGMAQVQTVEQLQSSFRQKVEQARVPVTDGRTAVPGIFIKQSVTPVGRCKTRIDLSRPAINWQGQQVPAASMSQEIDWSKTRFISYSNKKLTVPTGDKRITVTGYDDYLPETATSLQLACGAFSPANTPVPAGAPARWEQVRDADYKAWVACSYRRLPELQIEERWGGYQFVRWYQSVHKERHQVGGYSDVSINFSSNGLPDEVYFTLDKPDGQDFRDRAGSVELWLDGKKIQTVAKLKQSEGDDKGTFGWISIHLDGAEGAALANRLKAGSRLEARVLSKGGRKLHSETFNVSSFRNADTALNSTNYHCILG